jgi:hypothetical protein
MHDLAGADTLLPQTTADLLIADKAFDADLRVLQPLAAARQVGRHPTQAAPLGATRFRLGTLERARADREFLLQTQTVPRHCHAL